MPSGAAIGAFRQLWVPMMDPAHQRVHAALRYVEHASHCLDRINRINGQSWQPGGAYACISFFAGGSVHVGELRPPDHGSADGEFFGARLDLVWHLHHASIIHAVCAPPRDLCMPGGAAVWGMLLCASCS